MFQFASLYSDTNAQFRPLFFENIIDPGGSSEPFNPFSVSILCTYTKSSIDFSIGDIIPLIKISDSSVILLRTSKTNIIESYNGSSYLNLSSSWNTNDTIQLCFKTNLLGSMYKIGYRNITQNQQTFTWSSEVINSVFNPSATNQTMLVNKGKNSNIKILKILIYDTSVTDSKLISDML